MNDQMLLSGLLFVLAYATLMCLLFATMNYAVVADMPDSIEVRRRRRAAKAMTFGGIVAVVALYQLCLYVFVNGVGL